MAKDKKINEMINEATQIIDNIITEYREKEKNLWDAKEKESDEDKRRTIIGLFFLVNNETNNLEEIKRYLKNLKE